MIRGSSYFADEGAARRIIAAGSAVVLLARSGSRIAASRETPFDGGVNASTVNTGVRRAGVRVVAVDPLAGIGGTRAPVGEHQSDIGAVDHAVSVEITSPVRTPAREK
jgi:hypothetical protein